MILKMPRPGPRPYECVRRSWHSDRHQPIRGSIIQRIFRVVHENHSPSTKKNREWQEKLPLVLLKSEEIMYSKANSEEEYSDPETLWDRVNDAINTIIRKDESLETGEFLPPCVEAALNLGCVPVRSSRSQRNNNTRSYLGPRNQDSCSEPPKAMITPTNPQNPGSSFCPPPPYENFPKKIVSIESKASVGSSSVHPLYYGLHFQPRVPQTESHHKSNSIIVGTPIFQASHEPLTFSQKGCQETLFSFGKNDNGSNQELVECDLSLRLGLVSSSEKGLTFDLGQSNFQSTHQSKEFSFFPINSEGEEVQNMLMDVRKRKAQGGQCFLQLEPDFNQIDERIKRRGL